MAEQKPYSLGRRVRPIDDWACRMFAPATQNSDGKEPFLFIDFRYCREEKVRDIHIGVNLRKGGKEGKIDFFPNLVQFKALCEIIRRVADGRIPDGMVKTEISTTFMFGKKLDRPEVEFIVVVGKDEEGVFIGVSQKGRDNVKFYFTAPRMTVLRNRAGEIYTNAQTSELFAEARANIWDEYINHYLKTSFLDDDELEKAKTEKKEANQKRFAQRQGGGGGSWGGGNQSGGSSSQASSGGTGMDDDIPW